MEANSRWVTYAHTGRGFVVSDKKFRETGTLKRAGGAGAISAFAGFKD